MNSPLARKSDLETSHDAAKKLIRSDHKIQLAETYKALENFIEKFGDYPTCLELYFKTPYCKNRDMFHRRLPELRNKGLVENVKQAGKLVKKRTVYSKVASATWRIIK